MTFLFFTNVYSNEIRGTLHIVVENMRNSQGNVRIRLYNSHDGFPLSADKSLHTRTLKITKKKVETIIENLPYGNYAVGVLHDENGNGRMDLKWGFYPSEGAGTSNNPVPGLLPPSFEEAKITLDNSQMDVKIQMHY